ncbi:hypothetical protein [Erythrobacter rubeus]|uniref:Uncharacterized protein n=1 Tax=Erythrobacter rubeus TaxID=2760803 RepID=A0ABR8KU79_9SPHN|nr:hypothetical protein [Erythrobacter rubeus]MBD2842628.1 hypothetical protein [Erythrobacter rubeus]
MRPERSHSSFLDFFLTAEVEPIDADGRQRASERQVPFRKGDGEDQRERTKSIQEENPAGLKWHNSQRGYVLCDVTPSQWVTEFRTLEYVTERGGSIGTRKRMMVEQGVPSSLNET